MIKKLPPETLKYLLDMYNKIWEEGEILKTWMMNKRLVWYLEKEKKIDDRQFGFRKQRSTIDTISKITIIILDRFKKKKTAAIFFGIEKVYNKVKSDKTLDQVEHCRE